ncbi:MAG: hypothetical protein ACI3WR_02445 [Oscillospiraceae bacterium]
MNLPTLIGSLIILAVFVAIVGRGIYNWKRGKGGCSCSCGCGCEGCAACGQCHPQN